MENIDNKIREIREILRNTNKDSLRYKNKNKELLKLLELKEKDKKIKIK